jgi:DNA ligase (NAD+)
VRGAADLYELREEQLLELEGFGEISAKQPDRGDRRLRERPFARVLFAIGIEEVGEVTARNLVQPVPHDRRAAGGLPGGDRADPRRRPKMAASIAEQLATRRMRELIERLRAAGLRFEEEGPPPGEGPLAG